MESMQAFHSYTSLLQAPYHGIAVKIGRLGQDLWCLLHFAASAVFRTVPAPPGRRQVQHLAAGGGGENRVAQERALQALPEPRGAPRAMRGLW